MEKLQRDRESGNEKGEKKRLEGLVSSIEGERVTLIGSVMLYRDEPVEKPTY